MKILHQLFVPGATLISPDAVPQFEPLQVGQSGSGTAYAAITHEAFVGTLLDAPGAVLSC